jgi:radical SAM protein with 4Fe4S-binding SPASM domain
MSLDDLTRVCDFLSRSGRKKINVLGGEPTLHPEFSTYLNYLVSRNFKLHIFTNGKINKNNLLTVLDLIRERELSSRQLKFVVNVNEAPYRTAAETRMQARTFQLLGPYLSLSFNLFQKENRLDFLIELVRKYKLIPEIRLGLAAPVMGKTNQYLPPGDYREIAVKIHRFSTLCQKEKIDLVFDCGFPLCMFTDEEIGHLYKNKTQLKFTCRPIPDIDPGLNVLHCFPLAQYHSFPLEEFRDLAEVKQRFTTLIAEENGYSGIYPECRECQYKHRGICSGGCRGHYLEAN